MVDTRGVHCVYCGADGVYPCRTCPTCKAARSANRVRPARIQATTTPMLQRYDPGPQSLAELDRGNR